MIVRRSSNRHPPGELLRRLQTAMHHATPGDHGQLIPIQQAGGAAERQAVIVAGVGPAAFDGVQQGAVLEEEGRIIAAQRRAQQADGIGGVAGIGDAPAQGVGEDRLAAHAVPGVAGLLAETDRDAHHHRRSEVVGGAPAQGAQIVDLLCGRVGVLAELDLRHGQQPGQRHARRATDDAVFIQGGVEDPLGAELGLQTLRGAVHAAFDAPHPRRRSAGAG